MIPNTLEGELYRRKLRNNYLEYCKYVNNGYVETKFHKYLCDTIQEFIEYESTDALSILLIATPPRCGKTETVTATLPSWILGKDPTKQVIIASYQSEIAETFNRPNRDKFAKYGREIFGEKAIPNDKVQGVNSWQTAEGGVCHAAGLKAGITGYGADVFILDDPIKNQQEADSESIIGKIHDEMGPSVQSRIYPGGKLIVIGTPWVENDAHGYVRKHWKEFIWREVVIPFECEDAEHDLLGRKVGEFIIGEHLGDKNLPSRIDYTGRKGETKKQLVKMADGERTWNALYQCHPSAAQGNLFHRTWWKPYQRSSMSVNQFEYLCLSIDGTFKKSETSDFVGGGLYGIYHGEIYIWKLLNKRMGFVETLVKLRQYFKDFPQIDELIIETKANGEAIIDTLRYDTGVPPIVGVNPLGGKYSRAQAVSPYVSLHGVHVPTDWTEEEKRDIESDDEQRPDPYNLFVEQHAMFPFAKHDDLVDMNSQALTRLIKLITGEEPKPARRFIRYNKWYPDMWEDYERLNPMEQEQFIAQYGAPLEWQGDD